ncbi:MAG: type II toxin-antitoxin system RelE/ParE family toxin [Anaerolineae bacterium]|nr:type II toxin-antitoxin system RelE/ParE family toxin [Anaerolineae bacterium]
MPVRRCTISDKFTGEFLRRLPAEIQRVALRKLRMIDNAQTLNDLRVPPANHLEKLTGERNGQWSIRINDQPGIPAPVSSPPP